MNRILPALAVAVVATAVLAGCRKGPGDPWLSFSPRDKRISQTWQVKALDGIQVRVESGVSQSIRFEYNLGVITIIQTPGGSRNFGYRLRMDIREDGRMQAIETLTDSAGVQHESLANGYWNWRDDSKKKAAIRLEMPGLHDGVGVYDITRLAGDELILESFSTIDNTGPISGEELLSWDVELEFEPAPEQ